mgnify:CR=1 FL=1
MHVHSCISKFYALIGQFLDAYNSRTINATELNLCLYVYLELLYQLHLLSCICGHPLLNARQIFGQFLVAYNSRTESDMELKLCMRCFMESTDFIVSAFMRDNFLFSYCIIF